MYIWELSLTPVGGAGGGGEGTAVCGAQIVLTKSFSPKFPIFEGFDLSQATGMVLLGVWVFRVLGFRV